MIDANSKIVQQTRAEAVSPTERQIFARLFRGVRVGPRPQHKRLGEGVRHVKLGVAAVYVIALRKVVIDLEVALIVVQLVSDAATEVVAYSGIRLGMRILSRSK